MSKSFQDELDQSHNSIYDENELSLPTDFFEVEDEPRGLVVHEGGDIEVNHITATSIGLLISEGVTEEEWEIFGDTLVRFHTSYQWLVGDFLIYGEDHHYGRVREFGDRLGVKGATVSNWKSVCRAIEPSRRREELTFTHHTEVAGLPTEMQERWLEKAYNNGKLYSVKRLRREINGDEERSAKIDQREEYEQWDLQHVKRAHVIEQAIRKSIDSAEREDLLYFAKRQARLWQDIVKKYEHRL